MHPDVYFYVLGNPLIFYVLKSWVPMHKKVFLCIPMHKIYFFEISAREGREIFHVLRWNSLNKMRVHGSKRMQDVQFSGACGGLTEKQCFHNVIIHDKIFFACSGLYTILFVSMANW